MGSNPRPAVFIRILNSHSPTVLKRVTIRNPSRGDHQSVLALQFGLAFCRGQRDQLRLDALILEKWSLPL